VFSEVFPLVFPFYRSAHQLLCAEFGTVEIVKRIENKGTPSIGKTSAKVLLLLSLFSIRFEGQFS
jgi:hypothetical protein